MMCQFVTINPIIVLLWYLIIVNLSCKENKFVLSFLKKRNIFLIHFHTYIAILKYLDWNVLYAKNALSHYVYFREKFFKHSKFQNFIASINIIIVIIMIVFDHMFLIYHIKGKYTRETLCLYLYWMEYFNYSEYMLRKINNLFNL